MYNNCQSQSGSNSRSPNASTEQVVDVGVVNSEIESRCEASEDNLIVSHNKKSLIAQVPYSEVVSQISWGVRRIRSEYYIPSSYEIIIPGPLDRMDRPPDRCMTVHLAALRMGLRFPLHPNLCEIVKGYGLCLSQLNPRAICILICYILVMKAYNEPSSFGEFFDLFSLGRSSQNIDCGFYFFVAKKQRKFLTQIKLANGKNWRSRYIFIKPPEDVVFDFPHKWHQGRVKLSAVPSSSFSSGFLNRLTSLSFDPDVLREECILSAGGLSPAFFEEEHNLGRLLMAKFAKFNQAMRRKEDRSNHDARARDDERRSNERNARDDARQSSERRGQSYNRGSRADGNQDLRRSSRGGGDASMASGIPLDGLSSGAAPKKIATNAETGTRVGEDMTSTQKKTTPDSEVDDRALINKTSLQKRPVSRAEMEDRACGKRPMIFDVDGPPAPLVLPRTSCGLHNIELGKVSLSLFDSVLTDSDAMLSTMKAWPSLNRDKVIRRWTVADICREVALHDTAATALKECLMKLAWDAEATKIQADDRLSYVKRGHHELDASREDLKRQLKEASTEVCNVRQSWNSTKQELEAEKNKVADMARELAQVKGELQKAKSDSNYYLAESKEFETALIEHKIISEKAISDLKLEIDALIKDLREKDKLLKAAEERSIVEKPEMKLRIAREFMRSRTFAEGIYLRCGNIVFEAFDLALEQLKTLKILADDFDKSLVSVWKKADLTSSDEPAPLPSLDEDIFEPLIREEDLWIEKNEDLTAGVDENRSSMAFISQQMDEPVHVPFSNADLDGLMNQLASTSGLVNEDLVRGKLIDPNFGVAEMMTDDGGTSENPIVPRAENLQDDRAARE